MDRYPTASAEAIDQRRALLVASWLPLALVLALLVGAAIGHSPFGLASAASATDTIVVNGTVDKEIHMTPSCPAAALDLGTLVPNDPMVETGTVCSMTYGTNNGLAGASLNVSDATAPSGNAMACTAGGCTGQTFADYQGSSFPTSGNPSSAFGIRLASVTGATATWTLNAAGGGSGSYYDAADAADTACTTAGIGDATCDFNFAAFAAGTATPGSYQASIAFDAVAN